MQLHELATGLDVPNDIYVVVEIPAHGPGLKLELDKASGALLVDRFMATPMHYPCSYGFIPHTLSEDGASAGCAGGGAHAADLRRGGALPAGGHAGD